MIAEVIGIREALKYCSIHGWTNIMMETDSLALRNVLNLDCKIPWEILEIMEDIM